MSTKSPVLDRNHRPARDEAARAASKHGNPAEHGMFETLVVDGNARAVAAIIYARAISLEVAGEIDVLAFPARVTVVRDARVGGSHAEFQLRLTPRDATAPAFEGQIRVDHFDVGRARIVAQGRYLPTSAGPSADRGAIEGLLGALLARLSDVHTVV